MPNCPDVAAASSRPDLSTVHGPVEIVLTIHDRDLCEELAGHADEKNRHDFAVDALRIGVLAMRQAQGRLDADRVRAESDRLVENLGQVLEEHKSLLGNQLVGTLKEYFDPESGRFNERVERLTRPDGELERILRKQVGQGESELALTLATFLGENSPLMELLDPDGTDGFLSTLTDLVEKSATEQREKILGEFSLDNREGALSRLVNELAERHGKVGEALSKQIGEVVEEFSLDNDQSALSRLVTRVERAQRQISNEFSLDDDSSALARMRRELLEVFNKQKEAGDRFQKEVVETLAAMNARREEAGRSTRHGEVFESDVFLFLQTRSQGAGDVATPTGATTGQIKSCKVGDVVIELGREHVAAGARVVVEAKEKVGYSLQAALEELHRARENRAAEAGLFVFSRSATPEGLEPLSRHGCDVVVSWDASDPSTDVILIAGLEIARALCTQAQATGDLEEADLEGIDRAILEIERQASGLDEIKRFAETIKNNSEKILKRNAIVSDGLRKQVESLREKTGVLSVLLADRSQAA